MEQWVEEASKSLSAILKRERNRLSKHVEHVGLPARIDERAPWLWEAVAGLQACRQKKRVRERDRESKTQDPKRYADQLAVRQRRHRKANPEKMRIRDRRWGLKRWSGITLEEYERQFVIQSGLCKICRQPETAIRDGKVRALSADHCHTTGRFRGLVCDRCNKVLGLMNDRPVTLRAAADYLEATDNSDQTS